MYSRYSFLGEDINYYVVALSLMSGEFYERMVVLRLFFLPLLPIIAAIRRVIARTHFGDFFANFFGGVRNIFESCTSPGEESSGNLPQPARTQPPVGHSVPLQPTVAPDIATKRQPDAFQVPLTRLSRAMKELQMIIVILMREVEQRGAGGSEFRCANDPTTFMEVVTVEGRVGTKGRKHSSI